MLSTQLATGRSNLSRHSLQLFFPGMLNLTQVREWYEQYIGAIAWKLEVEAPLIQAVKDDELDAELVETRIAALRSSVSTTVSKNYCLECQALFDNWPDLSDSTITHASDSAHPPKMGGFWKHTVAGSCHTFPLEAAARNGYRFCMLLVQKLRDTEVLGLLRRIEARVNLLGEAVEASLSVQNWGRGPQQLLWVNWPGKVCEHCNGGISLAVTLTALAQ